MASVQGEGGIPTLDSNTASGSVVPAIEDATMKTLLATILLLGPALATAQDQVQTAPPAPQYLPPGVMQESAPPPVQDTPLPPQAYGPPQPDSAPPQAYPAPAPAPVVSAPSTPGQWVYTSQYGWVWMPYGAAYTSLPVADAYPDMYVYWPSVGWRWVVAPWVWGIGPRPYFGSYGSARYGWYGHGYGYGRWYGFSGHGPAWASRGYGWSRPYAAPHPVVTAPQPGAFGRPGGYVVPRPGGYVTPIHPGGFARLGPSSFARSAPAARPGSFGGGR